MKARNLKSELRAYKKVLRGIDSGKVDPSLMRTCQYTHVLKNYKNKVIHCGVGILFTPAQLQDLQRRNLNDSAISTVARIIGKDNIEEATGMPLHLLSQLQDEHDDCVDYQGTGSTKRFSQKVARLIKRHERLIEKATK